MCARYNLAVMGCVLASFLLIHFVMEYAARWSEDVERAYLWRKEEWLQIITPSNYTGERQLLMCGPSEAREGFLPEGFDARLHGVRAYQNSLSMGTTEDCMLLLEYIDEVYGAKALPDALLLGVTTRFVSGIRSFPSPLIAAIDRYSPSVSVDQDAQPPRLIRKSWFPGCIACARFRFRQQRRYFGALRALGRAVLRKTVPRLAENDLLNLSLMPSKYKGYAPRPIQETKEWLVEPGSFWEAVHAWDPAQDRVRIVRELRRLVNWLRRRHVDLYVVNMPELSWNRTLYAPGRYEAYLAAVREGLGETPFLDLREFLDDDLYFDSCHPIIEGCRKVTDRVGDFLVMNGVTGNAGN